MDPKVKKYLHEEFIPKRLKVSIPTRAIMPKEETEYLKYHEDQHNVVVLDKPLFNLANEISLFNGNQVAIFMYGTEELSGMIITSKSLHDTLKNLFELVRNIYYPTK
ncbi:MAG: hypothetical protein LBD11_04545 [Candidatus Peribacteria bacterium]|jgi:hypothetical protein|nr:hypothetical protein [Candidatus Peribacteria bacterium]